MILLPLLCFTLAAEPPMPERLPPLKGEFLSGRPALLPDAASGRVALLALGFTYDSRFAVEAWIKRFRTDYGDNPQTTFYEIPMIGGMAQLGKWFIDSGMRRGTPKADHDHVITVYGNMSPWKERVAFKTPDAAYLILLDKDGSVRWRHSGAFTEADYQRLTAAMKPLLPSPAQ